MSITSTYEIRLDEGEGRCSRPDANDDVAVAPAPRRVNIDARDRLRQRWVPRQRRQDARRRPVVRQIHA